RYTDVSELLLDAFSLEGRQPEAGSLDQVAPDGQEALGDMRARAGLVIQHDSSVVLARLEPELAAAGVLLESIDGALRDHPGLVEGRLHHAVPFDRTKFTALHAAFRTGGTFVY